MSNEMILLRKIFLVVYIFFLIFHTPFEFGWSWGCMECEEGERSCQILKVLGDIHFKYRNEFLPEDCEECSCSFKIYSLSTG